jgi:hypothetical protein
MRLTPIDVHILDSFRRTARVHLEMPELRRRCATYGCTDLDNAVSRLERDGLLKRMSDGKDVLVLTRQGRHYAGLAAIESDERIDQNLRA